ncbi:MAG: hypothetical protein QNJ20_14265 [Paracoccaceae bacterium]|nr:hypothetical protein [Paracoccaceae bacterium]
MRERIDEVNIREIPAPRSASFAAFWRFFHYGLPLIAAVAGLASLPVWLALPLAAVTAWMVPELWPMRVMPKVILADQLDIPRGMFFSNAGFVFLIAFSGFGIFHTFGAILLWFASGGSGGLHPHNVLPFALFWSGLWFLSRLLRHPLHRSNQRHIAQADRRRREALVSFTSTLRPEILGASANRRVI